MSAVAKLQEENTHQILFSSDSIVAGALSRKIIEPIEVKFDLPNFPENEYLVE